MLYDFAYVTSENDKLRETKSTSMDTREWGGVRWGRQGGGRSWMWLGKGNARGPYGVRTVQGLDCGG